MIVFFISFLTVYNYSRRQIVAIGTSYIFAVFLTYLLIGLGFFKALYSLKAIYWLNRILYKGLALICLILGILALIDYLSYRKTQDYKGQILQLPTSLKKRINQVFGWLRKREKEAIWKLVSIAFVVGLLVSILECACTGQIYIPTITLMMAQEKVKAFLYLILYNLMFVMPLIVIFLIALVGVSSQTISGFLRRHLGMIKISMAFLFFFLAGLLFAY